jgi:hypothetical protein
MEYSDPAAVFPSATPHARSFLIGLFVRGLGLVAFLALAVVAGYWAGTQQPPGSNREILLPLSASTSASSETMAMATGPVMDDAEGVFFLDFNTGDLQCLVYYPRNGAFGARFYTNVKPQLGNSGKNSKYLMVTGYVGGRPASSGVRPAGTMVYVTDVTTGLFAAYAIPWDRSMESSGRMQGGPLVFAGGGPIRNYELKNLPAANNPPVVQDPKNVNKAP